MARIPRFILTLTLTLTPTVTSLPARGRVVDVQLPALLAEGGGLLAHARRHGLLGRDAVRLRVIAHVLGDLHRAEVWAAHRAEVRALRGRRRQRLVVELARGLGVERQVELIVPPEF